MSELNKNNEYNQLIESIGETYQTAKSKVISAVNTPRWFKFSKKLELNNMPVSDGNMKNIS